VSAPHATGAAEVLAGAGVMILLELEKAVLRR
jgi:hypothetical protein